MSTTDQGLSTGRASFVGIENFAFRGQTVARTFACICLILNLKRKIFIDIQISKEMNMQVPQMSTAFVRRLQTRELETICEEGCLAESAVEWQ